MRPKGVVDGNQVNILEPVYISIGGTEKGKCSQAMGRKTTWSKCVGWQDRQIRSAVKPRHDGEVHLCTKLLIPGFREKLLSYDIICPYRKPTQVGR
jgi:5-methylcytosine-specific restriction endonuclease McrA